MILYNALILSTGMLNSSTPRHEEPKDLLTVSNRMLAEAKSVTGVFYIAGETGPLEKIEFRLAKPNKLSLLGARKGDFFDGVNHYIVYPDKKQYERRDFRVSGLPYLIGFEAFVAQADGKPWPNLPQYGNAKLMDLEGSPAIQTSYTDGIETVTVYIDAATKTPRGWNWTNGTRRSAVRFKNVELDKPQPPDTYTYKPSADFTQIASTDTRTTLAIGAQAPDFTDTRGRHFYDFLKTEKATVLAFINPNYITSAEILSIYNSMSDAYSAKGVGFVIASVGASDKDLKRVLKTYAPGLKVPVLNTGPSREKGAALYGVTAYPSIFLIDKQGKIAHRQIGFEQKPLEQSLADLGL